MEETKQKQSNTRTQGDNTKQKNKFYIFYIGNDKTNILP